jgi:hypothetical protein
MPAIRFLVLLVIQGDIVVPMLKCFVGAFGSGAAFALEDGWILARVIEYVRVYGRPIRQALKMFDEIRSPYYSRM